MVRDITKRKEAEKLCASVLANRPCLERGANSWG
jgi:hypothetical protein